MRSRRISRAIYPRRARERERGGRERKERGGIRAKKIIDLKKKKKGRNDRSRTLVVIAHQKTDRGSSNPSWARARARTREFGAVSVARFSEGPHSLLGAIYLLQGVSLRLPFIRTFVLFLLALFLLRCAVPKEKPGMLGITA